MLASKSYPPNLPVKAAFMAVRAAVWKPDALSAAGTLKKNIHENAMRHSTMPGTIKFVQISARTQPCTSSKYASCGASAVIGNIFDRMLLKIKWIVREIKNLLCIKIKTGHEQSHHGKGAKEHAVGPVHPQTPSTPVSMPYCLHILRAGILIVLMKYQYIESIFQCLRANSSATSPTAHGRLSFCTHCARRWRRAQKCTWQRSMAGAHCAPVAALGGFFQGMCCHAETALHCPCCLVGGKSLACCRAGKRRAAGAACAGATRVPLPRAGRTHDVYGQALLIWRAAADESQNDWRRLPARSTTAGTQFTHTARHRYHDCHHPCPTGDGRNASCFGRRRAVLRFYTHSPFASSPAIFAGSNGYTGRLFIKVLSV